KITYIISGFLAIIIVLILILFKIYYNDIENALDLVHPLFFGFLRVLLGWGCYVFSFVGLANYIEYNKEVISWKGTIGLMIIIGLFMYFMFDFPGVPLETALVEIGSVLFIIYLYIIQD
ncbi:MAG: hypothetical protein ACTSRP_22255, partial [Candidatus Helarchaeota archaeon]